MPLSKPVPGLVINYSFLWPHEADRNIEEGVKNRPCAIVVAAKDNTVLVVPITHRRPSTSRKAIQMPSKTKLRLGLDDEASWIITDSLNRFKWPGPDIRPLSSGDVAYGQLPHALTVQIRKAVLAHHNKKSQRTIKRDE